MHIRELIQTTFTKELLEADFSPKQAAAITKLLMDSFNDRIVTLEQVVMKIAGTVERGGWQGLEKEVSTMIYKGIEKK